MEQLCLRRTFWNWLQAEEYMKAQRKLRRRVISEYDRVNDMGIIRTLITVKVYE